jgi:hypothetical protein
MKKSILFGVLAMFAVSALGVQNVNAQNGDTIKNGVNQKITPDKENPIQPQQASQKITLDKEKPQLPPKEEQATTKGNGEPKKLSNKTASDPNIGKNKPQDEPKLKALQKDPKQQNDVQVEKKDTNKPMDYTNKKSNSKMLKYKKGEKVQNDVEAGNAKKNDEGTGNETIKKGSERVPNNAKVEKKDVNQNQNSGKETIKKGSERVPNNVNVEKKDANKNSKYDGTLKSKKAKKGSGRVPNNAKIDKKDANQNNQSDGTLKKKTLPSKPNSQVKPKDKPKENTEQNNNKPSDK